ncbi:MAG TPA: hypothetical protein VNJ02_01385 [Vicinamibacterales bacterium]|nr:hypothetical protein [Vicinamibacterales bacterium]
MIVTRTHILGGWRLHHVEELHDDNTITEPFTAVDGGLAYLQSGEVIVAWGGDEHFNAYFGNFELDTPAGVIRHRVRGGYNRGAAGTVLVRQITVDGDVLTLTRDGDLPRLRLTWLRAR